MSSKLLACLNYKILKVIKPEHFVIVWQDSQFRIHAVFYQNSFLNKSQRQIVWDSAKEILFIHVFIIWIKKRGKVLFEAKEKWRVFFVYGLCHSLCSCNKSSSAAEFAASSDRLGPHGSVQVSTVTSHYQLQNLLPHRTS